jgi:hypothetical protein
MNEFWMVWREGGNVPTKKHPTENEARIEAERLARANTGHAFVVLRAEAACQRVDVRWIGSSGDGRSCSASDCSCPDCANWIPF